MNHLSIRFSSSTLLFAIAFTVIATVASTGCRLCADCDLESYPSYGGAWQRTVRDSGRVGSVFDPGGSRASDLSQRVDSEAADAKARSENTENEPDEDATMGPGTESTDNPSAPRIDSDEQLKQMEERLRGLQLQDINHREPPAEQRRQVEDWR